MRQVAGAAGWPARFLFVLCMLALTASCRHVEPVAEADAESAIIVIPGYYGTRLVQSDTGQLIWLSLRQALVGRKSLALPIGGRGIEPSPSLNADGILKDIPVLPFLYSVEGYGRLLRTLERRLGPQARIVPFAYDWRMDLHDAVVNLHRTITQLQDRGVRRIALVAHSMGGLVAAYYLRYGTQAVDEAVENWAGLPWLKAVVLAGVPYLGSMTTFRNMQYGRRIGLNTSLLTADAVSSFPASYYVLPAPGTDLLWSASLEPLLGLLYEPDHWTRYGWGLLRDSASMPEPVVKSRAAYTETWLVRARRFFELLHQPASVVGPTRLPALVITGAGFKTLAAGYWVRTAESSDGMDLLFDTEQVHRLGRGLEHARLLSDGDGTVTVGSASLPPAYEASLAAQHRTLPILHSELVTDSVLLEEITAFLADTVGRP